MNSQIIEKIQKYFCGKPVLKAYLFGSYSRNQQDEESDIDILVELDHSSPIGLKFVEMQNEMREMLKIPVDLISDKAVLPYLRPYIEREKILIYEKS